MPADKDAAKRRRQARNRQERENRQARTEGAKRASTRPSRTVEETPAKSRSKTSLDKTPARSAPASGGILGRLFPPRPEAPAKGADGRPARGAVVPTKGTDGRPGRGAAASTEGAEARPARAGRQPRPPSVVVEVDDIGGARGLLVRLTAQPGGRAIVLALLVSVVFAVTLLAFPVLPSTDLAGYGETVVEARVEAEGGDDGAVDDALADFTRSPVESVRGLDYRPPQLYVAIGIALVPILIAGFAVRGLLRPTRSRTLFMTAIAGVLYFVANPGVGLYYVLGVIALGFGAYQSSKADKAALAASA
ncbi:MAG TPA: hypothetical protein VK507_10640 [Iamia sp.]|nr:hypothetical protein [Iamia sp.]